MGGEGTEDIDIEDDGGGRRGCLVTTTNWFINTARHSLFSANASSKPSMALLKSSFGLPSENMAATHKLLILDSSSLI
jgi:hypothetical protein